MRQQIAEPAGDLNRTDATVASLGGKSAILEAPTSLSILGATGSVGQSTLDVIAAAAPGRFTIRALSAHQNVTKLAAAACMHNAEIAVVANPDHYQDLKAALSGTPIKAAAGQSGLDEAADREVDCVMAAIVGAAGLRPALRAARRARRLAIANKECLVIAGDLFMREMAQAGTEVLPVDSEHAAVFQVLDGRDATEIQRVYLTASGGPFRDYTLDQMKSVTREQAVNHPNWSMGAKISVDSATMMNKGLELIEAHHLFGLDSEKFSAIIHPQSIVHCLIELTDGSVIAQMAQPDMRTPIAQSLYWPRRPVDTAQRIDFTTRMDLSFKPINEQKYPAFGLARDAMKRGGSAPAVLNGANEAAVAAFLDREIEFLDIATTVAKTMDRAETIGLFYPATDISTALDIDAEAKKLARDVMVQLER